MTLDALTASMTLESALATLSTTCGRYELLEHFQQGEFHHDLVIRLPDRGPFPTDVLVISTNCNGGVRELLAVESPPSLDALWHRRCPENPEFQPDPIAVRAEVRTPLWFEPCELLRVDARSELRPEHRERARGGGWQATGCRSVG